MSVARSRLALPLALIAAVALVMAMVPAALAAPSATTSSQPMLADHTGECNLTVDAEGNLLLDGEVLTGAELAAVESLLATNADLAAALEASADANADACVNLELTVDGPTITAGINAHIDICPATVEVNADGDLVINGTVFASDLADSDAAALVAAAAAADVALCAFITVTDSAVAVDLYLEACVTATLNSDGTVTITLGDTDLVLDADAVVDAEAVLEAGAAVEVGIALVGTVDLETDTVELFAEIIAIEGCGEEAPGGATPPPGGATTPPTDDDDDDGAGPDDDATPAPAAQLPDTSVAGTGAPTGVLVLVILALASVAILGYATQAVRRER